jgi:hypothetical protein
MDAPADGTVATDFVAADIDGTDWNNRSTMDYASHFPELALKRDGNIYRYEFSLKVYDDAYDHSDPEASRVALTQNREMGMSMAYCDNDEPDGERDNFFGSVWVPEEAYNDHWKDASGFGSLRLVNEDSRMNHPPVLKGSITDFQVSKADTLLLVHGGVSRLFDDPDGDSLMFSVECTEDLLEFTIQNDSLLVTADQGYSGNCMVKLIASDGKSEVFVEFTVSRDVTGTGQHFREIQSLHVYPNPFNDFFSVELGSMDFYEQIIIEVYSLSGRKIKSTIIDFHTEDSPVCRVDMDAVPGGVYIVTVRTGTLEKSVLITKK